MHIVGLVGKVGSGKDHMAHLLYKAFGFWPIALADQLKIELIARDEMTVAEAYVSKPKYVRTRLQLYGTEDTKPVYGEDLWIRALDAWTKVIFKRTGIQRFAVPDVRFANEAAWIRARGGLLVRLLGETPELTAEQHQHRSEIELESIEVDYDVVNTPGTYKQAEATVLYAVNRWLPT